MRQVIKKSSRELKAHRFANRERKKHGCPEKTLGVFLNITTMLHPY